MKLNNRHAAVHEPGAVAGPPENSCWEWNLEQALQATNPRSEEPEALDASTTVSNPRAARGEGCRLGKV